MGWYTLWYKDWFYFGGLACTWGAEIHEVNERGAGETHESDVKPLTNESLANLGQSILKEWKTDKNDARTGALM